MDKNPKRMSTDEREVQQPLPADFFPNCWTDDERMDNLFAPFRAKSVNPVNYERKLEFWRNLICQYCVQNGSPVVSINQLRLAFKRGEKKPYCLDVVLKELLSDGIVRPRTAFALKPQETWSGWAMNTFIKSPLQWSFNKVKERVVTVADATTDSLDTEFVVLDVVEVNKLKFTLIVCGCWLNAWFDCRAMRTVCSRASTRPTSRRPSLPSRMCAHK